MLPLIHCTKPRTPEPSFDPNALVFEVQTTTANESFTIPCNAGTFNAVVDWGDGTTSNITAHDDVDLTHPYSTAGTHQVSVTGVFPNVDFGNDATSAQKVIRVLNLGRVGWQSLADAFRGCSNMVEFSCGACDTSGVSNFSGMFRGASGMSICLVAGMDTSSATTMRLMFIPGVSLPELDLSTFDMSQVTDVHQMLRDYKGTTPIDLSNFDMSNVEDMGQFMRGADNVTGIDVSNWVTSSVESIALIFDNCPSATITGLSSFDIPLMTNAENALRDSALSTFEYDALLTSWESQSHQNNVTFHAGNSTYTPGGAAEAGRDGLEDAGWIITDDGAIANKLTYDGVDQSAEHSPWTPTGVNFTISGRYTMLSGAVGVSKTILGNALVKNANDQLEFSYTDTSAVSRTITLSTYTLLQGVEHRFTITSDGNGVTIRVGAETASNAAVIDPSTLAISDWMKSVGGSDFNNGRLRDVKYADGGGIQNGNYLRGNLIDLDISVNISVTNFVFDVDVIKPSDRMSIFGNDSDSAGKLFLFGSGTLRYTTPGGVNIAVSSACPSAGQHYKINLTVDNGMCTMSVDGKEVISQTVVSEQLNISTIHSHSGSVFGEGVARIKGADTDTGDTYEYLLNNIQDLGGGTGLAPNTGNSEGTVNLWQTPTLGSQWTDNGDGSYTLNGDGSNNQLSIGGLNTSETQKLTFTLSGLSGSGIIVENSNTETIFTIDGTYTLYNSGDADIKFKRRFGVVDATISDIEVFTSFDGRVNNYDPLTDLVAVPNNTRSYPNVTDSNIQRDILEVGAWRPKGVNYTQSLKYTPASSDIGSTVELLGSHLVKDDNDNLVYTYSSGGSRAVTLASVALVAGTQYTINITSTGLGVTLGIGANQATNSAAVNPSELNFNLATYETDKVRHVNFVDGSLIQNGAFLRGDGSTLDVTIPELDLGSSWTISFSAIRTLASAAEDAVVGYDQGNHGFIICKNNDDILFRSSATSQSAQWNDALLGISLGEHYVATITTDGSAATLAINGVSQGSRPLSDTTLVIDRLLSSDNRRYRKGITSIDINNGQYIYLLSDIQDRGDGTYIAPNTGSVGSFGPDLSSMKDYVSTGAEGTFAVCDVNVPLQPAVAGKTYKISLIISGLTAGSFNLDFPNTGLTSTTNGTTSIYVSPTFAGNVRLRTAGTQPNAGATASAVIEEVFDGVVNNFSPLNDLVSVPSNTRNYSNIDTLKENLFRPLSTGADWTDNLDGSYSWDSSGTDFVESGTVLEIGEYYSIEWEITEYTGTGIIGLSGDGFSDSLSRRSSSGVGVHRAVLKAINTNLRLFYTAGTGTGTVRNVKISKSTSADILNHDLSMFTPA